MSSQNNQRIKIEVTSQLFCLHQLFPNADSAIVFISPWQKEVLFMISLLDNTVCIVHIYISIYHRTCSFLRMTLFDIFSASLILNALFFIKWQWQWLQGNFFNVHTWQNKKLLTWRLSLNLRGTYFGNWISKGLRATRWHTYFLTYLNDLSKKVTGNLMDRV